MYRGGCCLINEEALGEQIGDRQRRPRMFGVKRTLMSTRMLVGAVLGALVDVVLLLQS